MSVYDDVKKEKDKLPYSFVPVKNKSAEMVDRQHLNVTKNSLYSGEVQCTLNALNYLCVGNTQNPIKINHKDDTYTEIKPLKIGGKIAISPYTLKGCISNFLAAYFAGPMRRVNNRGFIFRPNINFRGGIRVKIGVGILLKEENKYKILRLSELGLQPNIVHSFGVERNKANISEIKSNKNHKLKKVNKYYKSDKGKFKITGPNNNALNKSFYIFSYQNGLDGDGNLDKYFSELMHNDINGKHQHNAFYIDCLVVDNAISTNKELEFNEDIISAYKRTFEIIRKDHFSNSYPLTIDEDNVYRNIKKIANLESLSDGDIVFYEYIEKDKNVIVLTFGKTFYYPWAYEKEIKDFTDDIKIENVKKTDTIDILKEMFGFVNDTNESDKYLKAKSGKVHFNYAIHVEKTGTTVDLKLPIPGTPKPTAYEFYLRQNNNKCLTTYGDPARKDSDKSRLSGRKRYRSSIKNSNITLLNSENNNTFAKNEVKLCDVLRSTENTKPEFKFSVRFENMTKNELNYLLFALQIEQKYNEKSRICHQIGYGKNYGMGAVKIKIDKLKALVYDGNKFIDKSEEFIKDGELVTYYYNGASTELIDIVILHNHEFSYPKEKDNKDNLTIVAWHSNKRKRDFTDRRK